MVERLRSIRLTAEVDTNKDTYAGTFENVDELRAWLRDLDLGLDPDPDRERETSEREDE